MLLRRIPSTPNFIVTDEATGGQRPSSGAFAFGADGLSVYRAVLIPGREPPCDIVARLLPERPGRSVEFLAAECLVFALSVEADPTDQPIVGRAHALVRRKPGTGRSKAQRQLAGIARFCA